MSKIVNICNRLDYSGLSMDEDMVAFALKKAGYKIYHNGHPVNIRGVRKFKKIFPKLIKAHLMVLSFFGVKKIAVNIHLEIIEETDIGLAQKNIMIPNLEWLREDSYSLLSKMDLFVCKTKSAKLFLENKGLPAIYTSFTSASCYDGCYKQVPNTFVHISGTSMEKGTIPLAKLWSENPSWPKLTIIARSVEHLASFRAENLQIIGGYLEKNDLKRIQNESEVHLCPSEVEGFGHYICEALSCGAIVVTVDGEPMNELVQPSRGILIKVGSTGLMSHAKKYTFDSVDFERKINMLLEMSEEGKQQKKINARYWFNENALFFEKKLAYALQRCFEL